MKTIVKKVTGDAGLRELEKKFIRNKSTEFIPFMKNTPLVEMCNNVLPDRDGKWENPVFFVESRHQSTIGVAELERQIKKYLETLKSNNVYDMDILSITADLVEGLISIVFVVRIYHIPDNSWPYFDNVYEYLGETDKFLTVQADTGSKLQIPEDARINYSEADIQEHARKLSEQNQILENASEEHPFLNSLQSYTPQKLYEYDPKVVPVYDLLTKDMQMSTILPYDDFIHVFRQSMQYITTVEQDSYYNVIRGKLSKNTFFDTIETYLINNFVEQGLLPREDLHVLQEKLNRSLFELYIVQDLIDDSDITDIKIVSPKSIRVRIHGKAYMSNISFIDDDDYFRFINGIAIKNNIDLNVPSQTFTDEHDKNYILRFSITAPYITPKYPIIHIRKVSRKKMMSDDLIQAGMFDEKIRDYLLDCGKNSRGVVFAGPPGSGKTVCLNWFLEDAYEDSAEILVIQENDELFCYRQGVMFEHVVNNPMHGEQACSLEQLGQMALVAGANVFVIGEAKGAEICSAITLSNSGCRTAITIHSPSSTETIDKMADLAMRGYAQSYDQAIRMMKSFQTIVYLQDFKVQEISEIVGYNEQDKKIQYRYIYRREEQG